VDRVEAIDAIVPGNRGASSCAGITTLMSGRIHGSDQHLRAMPAIAVIAVMAVVAVVETAETIPTIAAQQH
jgi:hypothetical protein